jgi:hypothetical protein
MIHNVCVKHRQRSGKPENSIMIPDRRNMVFSSPPTLSGPGDHRASSLAGAFNLNTVLVTAMGRSCCAVHSDWGWYWRLIPSGNMNYKEGCYEQGKPSIKHSAESNAVFVDLKWKKATGYCLYKIGCKVKLSLCLTKSYTMKTYGGVDV